MRKHLRSRLLAAFVPKWGTLPMCIKKREMILPWSLGVCYFQTHPQCQMSNMRNGLAGRFHDANVKKWFESSNRRAGQCLLHGRSPLCQGAPAKCCHCWGMVSPIFTVETMLGQSSSLHNLCWNRSLTDPRQAALYWTAWQNPEAIFEKS